MEFEDILEKVGGYGKFQKKLTVFFLIPVACVIPWFWMNLIFIVSVPPHWCYVPEVAFSNLSISQQRLIVSPPDDASCSMYNISYADYVIDESFVIPENVTTIPCAKGWQYDKENYDSTAATKWNMVCSRNHWPSLILFLQNVGSLLGTPVFGYFSDKFGRKVVLLLLGIVVSSTEIASVFVDDFIVFAVLRTINGTILPSMFTLPYILILEIVAPDMRGRMNGVINTSWTLGLCLLPLFAYLSRSWVVLGVISGCTGMSVLLYWKYLPESPSWLLSQDRCDEALDVMMMIGDKNKKPQKREEIKKLLQTLGEEIKRKKKYEMKDSGILKYPRLRRNFLILSFCWTAFNVAYGGLTYNLRNLEGNEFINFFLLSVVEFPGNVTFWYLMDRVGRRWTATFGFILIGISSLLPIIGFQYSDVISSMIGKFLIAGIMMVTDQQGSELFPTVARSFGMGTGKTIATAATLMMPYIAYLSVYGKAIPFVIIGLTCVFAGILAAFLPETLSKNLPQTISDAEDFGKDQKFFSWNKPKEVTSDLPKDCKHIQEVILCSHL
ncbi:hypothetical protein JTE90_005735 [Oedothorax gibbosus]|uniref:Major facilitator superfamily (MFS) profile domain-containing protein n=1 Tax=Oedothorax gibbosus TaxID=931172 RepID=A0AAV6TYP8_9ARAC|nr:hypothetical protein JTE90_005735 [Oedothorax gibbosus]